MVVLLFAGHNYNLEWSTCFWGLLQEDDEGVVAAHGFWKTLEHAPITFAHRQVPILINFHGREKGVYKFGASSITSVIWDLSLSRRVSDSPVAVGACTVPQFSGCFHGIELGTMTGGFAQRGWDLRRERWMDGGISKEFWCQLCLHCCLFAVAATRKVAWDAKILMPEVSSMGHAFCRSAGYRNNHIQANVCHADQDTEERRLEG